MGLRGIVEGLGYIVALASTTRFQQTKCLAMCLQLCNCSVLYKIVLRRGEAVVQFFPLPHVEPFIDHVANLDPGDYMLTQMTHFCLNTDHWHAGPCHSLLPLAS